MRRRLILSLFAAALAGSVLTGPGFAGTAIAAEEAKKDDGSGLNIDLAQAGLPVIQNGRLVNYVFVKVRLVLTPGSNTIQVRTKEPYFRDALVRAAYRTPFTVAGDPNVIDTAALARVLGAEAARITGPRIIASVQVMSQTPKRFVPKG